MWDKRHCTEYHYELPPKQAQRVVHRNKEGHTTYSELLTTNKGVHQGLISRLNLFVNSVNDLPVIRDDQDVEVILLADDTSTSANKLQCDIKDNKSKLVCPNRLVCPKSITHKRI